MHSTLDPQRATWLLCVYLQNILNLYLQMYTFKAFACLHKQNSSHANHLAVQGLDVSFLQYAALSVTVAPTLASSGITTWPSLWTEWLRHGHPLLGTLTVGSVLGGAKTGLSAALTHYFSLCPQLFLQLPAKRQILVLESVCLLVSAS